MNRSSLESFGQACNHYTTEAISNIGLDGILWYLVFECKINLAVSSFVLFIFFSTNLFLKVEFHSQVKIRMGQPEAVNGKWTDNTMVKREKRKQ
jgi:hypothetical protein